MNYRDRHITRRKMMARSAQWTTCGLMLSRCESLLAAPRSRWFKIGACEWNLGQAGPGCLEIARQIGLDGVQANMGSLHNSMHLCKPEVQKACLEAAKRTGREIASLALAELNRVPLKSDPRAAQWLADSIDVCKALGVRITMPAFFGAGELDMRNTKEIDHVVAVLKDLAPRAEKEGIVIALENYLSAVDNLKLIDRIGSPAVKVYYDVGNSTDKGYDIYEEIRLLGGEGRLCEFHVKDGSHRLGVDQGRIDFKRVRKAMDDVAYRGWIQLESAHPNGVVPDYRAQLKFLRGVFPVS